MKEIWKIIKVGKLNYQISSMGNIMNMKGKLLSPCTTNCGYLLITLSGRKAYLMHRLVSEVFIPNPENKRTVNHKNGIKSNNRIDNLEWMTHKENTRHAHDTLNVKTCKGVPKKYKNGNPKQKMNIEIVRGIKLELKSGMTGVDIAKKHNVCTMTVSRINTNKLWKHIKI